MTEHELKTWPEHLQAVKRGVKTLEIRRDDRGYQAGDVLHLREWEPNGKGYGGEELRVRVTHVLPGGQFGLVDGYVAMSIRPVTAPPLDPEEAVTQAVASAELAGATVTPEWRETLHKVATGEISADEVVLRERLVATIQSTSEPPWSSDGAEDVADSALPLVTSWDWLMAVLAVHYPPDVVDGSSGDPGPRIVALAREVDRLRREAEGAVSVSAEMVGMDLVEANQRLNDGLAEIGVAAGLPADSSAETIRAEVAELPRIRDYLAEQLGHKPGDVPPDKELLWSVALFIEAGQQATRGRAKESGGKALTREELQAEFAKRERCDG
jgi:Domain of unknown function (DUF3850)/Antitoxin VbhA